MKSPAFAVAVCLFLASGVNAQTLTKAEEGRKEVGNCYRMCMADDGGGRRLWNIAWLDQFWANWRDSVTWTDEEWTSFLTDWKQTGCANLQAELLEAYGCPYACYDFFVCPKRFPARVQKFGCGPPGIRAMGYE